MKHKTPSDLFNAHLRDLSETFDGDYEDIISALMTQLTSVLFTMHNGDDGMVLSSLEGLVEYFDTHRKRLKRAAGTRLH